MVYRSSTKKLTPKPTVATSDPTMEDVLHDVTFMIALASGPGIWCQLFKEIEKFRRTFMGGRLNMEAGYGHCRVIALSRYRLVHNAITRQHDNAITRQRDKTQVDNAITRQRDKTQVDNATTRQRDNATTR